MYNLEEVKHSFVTNMLNHHVPGYRLEFIEI
jgi:hypothetical protein